MILTIPEVKRLQRTDKVIDTTLTINEIKFLGEKISLYEPLDNEQRGYFKSQADIRWLFGGNQSGKTYTNMMDLAQLALDVHPFRSSAGGDSFSSAPGGVHWAAIESWEQVRDILWKEYLEKFIPKQHIVSGGVSYMHDKIPKRVHLKNGHTIEFKAFNQGRDLFQGRAIDSCHCDEQCHYGFQGIFDEIQARIMTRQGYLSWSLTPIIPQPFLEERMDDLPDTDEAFHLDLNNNRISQGGYINDNRIDKLIDDWPVEVQATRIKGRFASFYGSVFKTFSRSVHVIKPFEIPRDWRRYRGFDFGFTNPFVCLWAAQDKDDNWYIYREYYQAKTVIGEHITNVKRMSGDENYVDSFADPEDPEARKEMKDRGIPTKMARNEIAKGVEVVQGKLKIKENGKPSLFIFNMCRNTCREIATYHYPTGTSTKDPKDLPAQVNDHTVDGLRYVIYSVEKPARKGSVYVG